MNPAEKLRQLQEQQQQLEEHLKPLKWQLRNVLPGSPEARALHPQIDPLEKQLEDIKKKIAKVKAAIVTQPPVPPCMRMGAERSPSQPSRPDQPLLRAEHFVGRETELAILVKDLQPGRVVSLCGPGGIGKTALAAEAVATLQERGELTTRFPDGVIVYSFYGQPDPMLAFAHIIRSFDPDAREISAQAAQAMLMHKRALLILDGTEEAEDVQRVLNIRGTCGVLVTSRRKQDALAERQDMPPLPIEDTISLLCAWGGDRIKDDEATHRLCEQLGGLPLAARLAGRYLSQTGETAAEYLDWLDTSPFEALHQGAHREESVNLLLERSVQQVSENARRVLAVVGVLNLSPFAVEPLAAALVCAVRQIRTMLSELVTYGLLVRPEPCYSVSHALIHTYAGRRLPIEPDTLRRLADYYNAFAREHREQGLAGYARLDTERAHILRVIDRCQTQDDWQAVNDLVWVVAAQEGYLDIRGYWTERVTALTAGIHAARQLGKRYDEGAHLNHLGLAYANLGQEDQAIESYEQALTIAREVGDRRGEGADLGNLGVAYAALGQMDQAIEFYEQALMISRELGDRRGEGADLGNLGAAYYHLGQVDQAIAYYEQALTLARELGDRRNEGNQLGNLGLAYAALGQIGQAIAYYEQALTLAREIGDRRAEGSIVGNLGNAYRHLGQVGQAIAYYEQALSIQRDIGDRHGEGNHLGNLGAAYYHLGQVDQAIEYHEQALTLAREIGDRRGEGIRLGNLGAAYAALGQVNQAIEYHEQALTIDRDIGNRRGEGADLGNLGNAYADLGQVNQAIEYYEQALTIAREIGDRRGEGQDLGNLGNAYADLGQMDQAIAYYEQALTIAREIGDRRGEGNHLGNLGTAYHRLGQVDQAIAYYEQALTIDREIGDRQNEGIWLANLGNAYKKLGQPDRARELWQQALTIFEAIRSPSADKVRQWLAALDTPPRKGRFTRCLIALASKFFPNR